MYLIKKYCAYSGYTGYCAIMVTVAVNTQCTLGT